MNDAQNKTVKAVHNLIDAIDRLSPRDRNEVLTELKQQSRDHALSVDTRVALRHIHTAIARTAQ